MSILKVSLNVTFCTDTVKWKDIRVVHGCLQTFAKIRGIRKISSYKLLLLDIGSHKNELVAKEFFIKTFTNNDRFYTVTALNHLPRIVRDRYSRSSISPPALVAEAVCQLRCQR